MKKVLIWGTGIDYENNVIYYKYHESIWNIKVVGITGNDNYFSSLDGYEFIKKEDIPKIEFDYLVIASIKKFLEIKNEANALGISDEKIISTVVFKIPNLNLDNYIKLKNSNISILSNNCWGGITYNNLGLKFNSPFINMYQSSWDYIKILRDLSNYIDSPLEFLEMQYDPTTKLNYPVCLLNDVKLHINHTNNFEVAKEKWDERKIRLNMDNLFVMLYTQDEKIATEFEELKYDKKVCFTSFETDLPSAFYLDFSDLYKQGIPFWKVVNGCAFGTYKAYDIIDLLLTGERKKSSRVNF